MATRVHAHTHTHTHTRTHTRARAHTHTHTHTHSNLFLILIISILVIHYYPLKISMGQLPTNLFPFSILELLVLTFVLNVKLSTQWNYVPFISRLLRNALYSLQKIIREALILSSVYRYLFTLLSCMLINELGDKCKFLYRIYVFSNRYDISGVSDFNSMSCVKLQYNNKIL